MKIIYFVRHGQTHWNVLRKLQGQKNAPLTDTGIEQALLLKPHLQTLSIDALISSPLGRAVETSELLLPNVEIQKEPLIAEMHFGSAEGLDKEIFKQTYPKQVQTLWTRAHQYDPSAFNGENFISLQKRARTFLNNLKLHPAQNVVVVAHGLILKMLFSEIRGASLEQFWADPVPQNTSITTVTLDNDTYAIDIFSDTSHLTNSEEISYL